MTATHDTNCTVCNAPVLYLALDLGTHDWKLACTVGLGQPDEVAPLTKPPARKLDRHRGDREGE